MLENFIYMKINFYNYLKNRFLSQFHLVNIVEVCGA